MDEKYRAKLTASPPSHHRHPTPGPSNPQGANDIHIQPHYPIPVVQGQPQPQPNTNGLIPVHLPSIYVNPFPPQPPAPAPSTSPHAATHQHSTRPSNKTIKIGPWKITKPHPLLWLCLGLSILALVLEVPKGSLPTLTGRHKALRTREKILKDRLNLLTQLSVFLPPPLSHLIAPSANPSAPFASVDDQLHVVPALRFWNTHTEVSGLGHGGESVERWWSVEDLGEGASVVRSKGEGEEKEVWVLGVGENESGDKTLLHALTHSLLMRDRLLSEITRLKSMPSPTCPQNQLIEVSSKKDIQDSFELDELRKEEWDKIESFKRREREREKEVEEREREVGRREKWVVDEMRKLSDKVHSQATELTLEDKITERLKAYQRQLAQVTEHGEV